MTNLKKQLAECRTVSWYEKNKILSETNLFGANLSDADLSRANLFGANLFGANLSRADLSDADLSYANLFDADLSGADLSDADLSYANLLDADLSGADLSGADLSRANLFGANLSRADFRLCGKWRCSYFPEDDKIKIGCKVDTLTGWHSFFSSDKVFETKRDTFDFFEIEHNFRWFCRLMIEYPKEFGVKQ